MKRKHRRIIKQVLTEFDGIEQLTLTVVLIQRMIKSGSDIDVIMSTLKQLATANGESEEE